MVLITGQIIFDHHPPAFGEALLTVELEDISLTGIQSTILASYSRIITDDETDELKFELKLYSDFEIDPRATYSVSAHFSLHPDDDPAEVREGDYLTMQTYPVLTHDNPTTIEVMVKRIG